MYVRSFLNPILLSVLLALCMNLASSKANTGISENQNTQVLMHACQVNKNPYDQSALEDDELDGYDDYYDFADEMPHEPLPYWKSVCSRVGGALLVKYIECKDYVVKKYKLGKKIVHKLISTQ